MRIALSTNFEHTFWVLIFWIFSIHWPLDLPHLQVWVRPRGQDQDLRWRDVGRPWKIPALHHRCRRRFRRRRPEQQASLLPQCVPVQGALPVLDISRPEQEGDKSLEVKLLHLMFKSCTLNPKLRLPEILETQIIFQNSDQRIWKLRFYDILMLHQ